MGKMFGSKSKRTLVSIHVEHLTGGWPIWFTNDVSNDVNESGLPDEIKRAAYRLPLLFEESALWDSNVDCYRWRSASHFWAYHSAIGPFAQSLANHLGPNYEIRALVDKPRKSDAVRFKWKTYSPE